MAPQTATRMTYEEFMALPYVECEHYQLIAGVTEYWMVDPEKSSAMIIRNGEEAVVADAIVTPLLPGFSMPLRDVFEEEP